MVDSGRVMKGKKEEQGGRNERGKWRGGKRETRTLPIEISGYATVV